MMEGSIASAMRRRLPGGFAAVGLVLASCRAVAHEDEHDTGQTAEAMAPGLTAMGLLILATLAFGVWYYLRRHALLRAARRPAPTSEAPGERSSEGP